MHDSSAPLPPHLNPTARTSARKGRAKGQTARYYPYRTPYGILTICIDEEGVCGIALGEASFSGALKPTDLAARCATQIQEYLAGKRRKFDLPLSPQGSPYQLSVWERMRAIPYGESLTCAEMAASLGNAEGFRSVGSAVRKNPLPILIPSHRVVGSDGKPLGTGKAADLQHALLKMEQDALAKSARAGAGNQMP